MKETKSRFNLRFTFLQGDSQRSWFCQPRADIQLLGSKWKSLSLEHVAGNEGAGVAGQEDPLHRLAKWLSLMLVKHGLTTAVAKAPTSLNGDFDQQTVALPRMNPVEVLTDYWSLKTKCPLATIAAPHGFLSKLQQCPLSPELLSAYRCH